ncbi:MAG TPA: ABC transporter substrate-binding protein [Roseiarcus sp.]|nr:ABC transporter substrate-binding protein [Roseiarcus sp.]
MDRRQLLVWSSAFALAPRVAFGDAIKPLKIGIMNDMSSVYADYQGVGSIVATKLAVDDYSQKLGVPVEIVSADHQNKPDIGSAIARRWFDEDGVDVIMDLPNSSVALAVVNVATEKNKAAIGSGAGSSVLTGPKCSRNFIHWTYDTYALGHGLGKALTEQGGKTWFFIIADYAFGKDLKANCAAAVEAAGGKVLGEARHPLNTADFSSYLLQAQASGADIVGLANAGGDLNTCIKQAAEFGLTKKQRLAGLILNVTNIPSLGLAAVQNSTICTGFYWDMNDGARAFAKRFQAAHPKKMMPNDMHAGMYSATAHLLKAMAVIKSAADGVKLIDQMKAMPTDDPLFGRGSIRIDGRKLHPMYLLETKTVAESKGEWDYFKVLATIKPEDAFRPLDKGGCPFVKA